MAREIPIGLSLIGVLLVAFVAVAYQRFNSSSSPPPPDYSQSTASTAIEPLGQPQSASASATIADSHEFSRHESLSIDAPASAVTAELPDYLPPRRNERSHSPPQIPAASNESTESFPDELDSRQFIPSTPRDELPAPFKSDGGDFRPIRSPETNSVLPPPRDDPQRSEANSVEIDSAPTNRNAVPETLELPPPRPVAGHTSGAVMIRANDSFWSISQRAYGTGAYFKALYEHNRDRFPQPDRLPLGETVDVPSVEELRRRYPDHCPQQSGLAEPDGSTVQPAAAIVQPPPTRIYVVKQGDTLFDIARFELGQASRYVEIIELNRERLGEDFLTLKSGTKLLLPSEPRTRKPHATDNGSPLE